MSHITKIGVMTSGGDSPGMNAAIRAVVRTAIFCGLDVYGIYRGYEGLIDNHIEQMYSHSVSNIIQRGGTILKTARSKRFMEYQGRLQAFNNLKEHNIDALVAIGGNGTFTGASVFNKEFDFPIIGLPGTIDNDLFGTDSTIGYDTAINTVVEAADKIRDTATSHERLFFLEVMGRDAGFIALRSGIACGAEFILVPETTTYIDNLARLLRHDWRKNKTSGIVIVAEGDDMGGAYEVAKKVKEKIPEIDTRVTILGHIQRGGSPSAYDRVLASSLGFLAVKGLLDGHRDSMAGIIDKVVTFTPFEKAIKHTKDINKEMLEMSRILAL
ncbi:MAG: 6-phosphofructokinase [Bacteroidales bacterium]|nr:6-phosphofructokinase [Bacteroidales bacterium]HNW74284.1 6-phosphofructokinase [Bacteroidales bacterium]HPS50204.1 6-phosphofructokinase [Bacteroidales bacterium]